jgi:hypothetical protein
MFTRRRLSYTAGGRFALCFTEMAQNRLEKCVWSPHGKGSSHSKAEWGRHPGPKRMVFPAGVSCGLRSGFQKN